MRRHFFGNAAPPPEGPPPQAIERTRKLVDWQAIDVGRRRIVLERPGMGVTLNGIAQGYITDRITDILRAHGCDRTFANLGCSEIRAQGSHAEWTALARRSCRSASARKGRHCAWTSATGRCAPPADTARNSRRPGGSTTSSIPPLERARTAISRYRSSPPAR